MLTGLLHFARRPFSMMSNPLKVQLQPVSIEFPSTPNNMACLLRTTESKLRTQMINPKNKLIERQQAELITLINGFKLCNQSEEPLMKERPPVVTIMGHVDHGKTTLLDFLRNSDIAKHQHGGITQKIGAFNVSYKDDKVTVIDTPGHQAFVNMRLRGATVTDMIILVISATEGIKQQTIEVINLAKGANIPLIIAINKIDIPEADPESIQKDLLEHGVVVEPEGGKVPVVHISAKNGINVDLLIELVLEQWKQAGVKAQYNGCMEGTVVQAHYTEGDMQSATLLLQRGILKVGDYIVCGKDYCKVRQIKNDRGEQKSEALPGEAVEIFGFKELPSSGQLIFKVENEEKAKYIIDKRCRCEQITVEKDITRASDCKIKIANWREKKALYRGLGNAWLEKFRQLQQKIMSDIAQLEELMKNGRATKKDEQNLTNKKGDLLTHKQYVHQYLEDVIKHEDTLNIIIKSSDRGCEETVLKQLDKIKKEAMEKFKITLNLIKSDVGEVIESDVKQAHSFNACIFTFGTVSKPDAIRAMKQYNVSTKNHKLLHNLLEDIRSTVLKKSTRQDGKTKVRGQATIHQVFNIALSKKETKQTAGVKISEGRICKKHKFKLFRNGKPVSDFLKVQRITSFKKDVIEVKKGEECCILFETDVSFKKGDVIKAYE